MIFRRCHDVVAVEARAGYAVLILCERIRGHAGACRNLHDRHADVPTAAEYRAHLARKHADPWGPS